MWEGRGYSEGIRRVKSKWYGVVRVVAPRLWWMGSDSKQCIKDILRFSKIIFVLNRDCSWMLLILRFVLLNTFELLRTAGAITLVAIVTRDTQTSYLCL